MGLISELRSTGYEVSVISPIDDFITYIYDSGIHYYPLYKLTRKSLNPFGELQLFQEFIKIYKKARPDVVIQYTIKPNIYGGLAAKRLGIQTISVIPGLGYAFVKPGLLQQVSRLLYRRSLRHSAHVVFENLSDQTFFIKKNIVPANKCVYFKGCGVDTEHFFPITPNGRPEGRIFLYMGRLITEKGVGEFVQAAKIMAASFPAAQFWIIGHIDEQNPSAVSKNEFVKWIEHPQIHYLGFKHDVRQTIADCDCVVLPTYYPEGIPRVLQEAMSMEKPIITTDANGCREAVDVGINGLLVKPRSVDDLAEKMSQIASMPDHQLLEMGRNGRKKAIAEFDEKITVNRYLKLVDNALKLAT